MPRSSTRSKLSQKPGIGGSLRNRAAGAGIFGGTGLASFAQTLQPPWNFICSALAPTVSVGVAVFGPVALDKLVIFGRYISKRLWRKYSIRRLEVFQKKTRRLLEDPSLSEERRVLITRRLEEVQSSIDMHELDDISPHLLGDSVAGLREIKSEERNTPPNSLIAERTKVSDVTGGDR